MFRIKQTYVLSLLPLFLLTQALGVKTNGDSYTLFHQESQCAPYLEVAVSNPIRLRLNHTFSEWDCCSRCVVEPECAAFSYNKESLGTRVSTENLCELYENPISLRDELSGLSAMIKTVNLLLRRPPFTSAFVTCEPTGTYLVPHETDCSRYVFCLKGTAMEMQCPESDLFDAPSLTCLAEDIAECFAGASPPPTTTPFPIICNPDVNEVLPHPHDCSKYFWCLQGIPIPRSCDEGQLFDPIEKQCDDADNVICHPGATTMSTSTTTTALPTITTDPPDLENECIGEEDGFTYGHPYDCRKYFVCRNENNYEFQCTEGLIFSIITNLCTRPEDGECRDGATVPPTAFPTTDSTETSTTSEEEVTTTFGTTEGDFTTFGTTEGDPTTVETTEGDSTTFGTTEGDPTTVETTEGDSSTFGTTEGDPTTVETTDGDSTTFWTTEDGSTTVSTSTTTTALTTITTDVPDPENECIGEEDGFVYGHPYDCRKYFLCLNENNYEFQCTEGLIFSIITNLCTRPEDGECRSGATVPPTTFPTTQSTTPSNATPTTEDDHTLYTTPESDKESTSPATDDTTTSTTTTTITTTFRTTSPTEDPTTTPPAYIPHPPCIEIGIERVPHLYNCHLYFICEDGVATQTECPNGQIFDYIRKTCDSGNNAICHPGASTTTSRPSSSSSIIPCYKKLPPIMLLIYVCNIYI